jgi:hypothetical protein
VGGPGRAGPRRGGRLRHLAAHAARRALEWGHGRRRGGVRDPSEEGETPDEHDLEILETLEEHGEDLAQPREIRIDLLFPDEDSANAAEEELAELGYEVAGFEAAGEEEQWSLRATRELRVDRDNVTGFRHRFEELAARYGGEFDGWEAAAD